MKKATCILLASVIVVLAVLATIIVRTSGKATADGVEKEPVERAFQARTPASSTLQSMMASRVDRLVRKDVGHGLASASSSAKSPASLSAGQQRADAHRAVQRAWRCLRYGALPTIMDSETRNSAEGRTNEEATKYLLSLHKLGKEAAQLGVGCDSVDLDQLKSAMPALLLRAARLGDRPSRWCYVSGYALPYPGTPEGEAALDEYRRHAGPLVDAALKQGDWVMLHLLTQANNRGSGYQSAWVHWVIGTDAEVAYALNRLELHGASAEAADAIQRRLESIRRQHHLAVEQVASLDRWADAIYERYFIGHPRQAMPDSPCAFGPG